MSSSFWMIYCIAECLGRLTVKVAIVPGSIPTSFDTVAFAGPADKAVLNISKLTSVPSLLYLDLL